jgi:hypothetical protein
VAQWSDAGLDVGSGLLPPRETQPEEPWFLRLGPAIVEVGAFVAFYFVACAGMTTTSGTIFNLALGVALSLVGACVFLRVLAMRACRSAERAITDSVALATETGRHSEAASVMETAAPTYHQA